MANSGTETGQRCGPGPLGVGSGPSAPGGPARRLPALHVSMSVHDQGGRRPGRPFSPNSASVCVSALISSLLSAWFLVNGLLLLVPRVLSNYRHSLHHSPHSPFSQLFPTHAYCTYPQRYGHAGILHWIHTSCFVLFLIWYNKYAGTVYELPVCFTPWRESCCMCHFDLICLFINVSTTHVLTIHALCLPSHMPLGGTIWGWFNAMEGWHHGY